MEMRNGKGFREVRCRQSDADDFEEDAVRSEGDAGSGVRYRKAVLIGTLAREEAIPVKFLEVILLDLKGMGFWRAGWDGRRYRLSRRVTVTIGSIIRILEGPLAPLRAPARPLQGLRGMHGRGELRNAHHHARGSGRGIRGAGQDHAGRPAAARGGAAAGNATREPLMYHI